MSFLDGDGHAWTITGPSVSSGYTDVRRDDGLLSCRVTEQLHRALGVAATSATRRCIVATKTKRPPTDVPESGWACGDKVTLDGRQGRVTGFARDRVHAYV